MIRHAPRPGIGFFNSPLKHYLDQGVSKAELSRRFGVSRATIHHWTDTGQLDRDLAAGARGYAPRPLVAHKLDPYKAIIDARLEAFPKLSAKRLFDEVRAAGYPGGYGRVRDYVLATRPREPVEATVRFETPPGHQGQVDFGTFTLPWGRRHALVIVVGYRPPPHCAHQGLLVSRDNSGHGLQADHHRQQDLLRLMGNRQLPKVIEGVRFKDGMQIDETKTRAAA